LAWASSVYLPAILADPIADDLKVSANWMFGAYSATLAVAAVLGPRVGRKIDRVGGRPVLSLSNLMLAVGLGLLGLAQSAPSLVIAWLVLGVGMGYGLYDAAFGALGRIYGKAARGPITGITLIAGFASTIGWPLTALGASTIGWRHTCFAWSAAHILIGLPLNLFMLPTVKVAKATADNIARPHIALDSSMILLAFIFASAWTVTGAMAALRGDRRHHRWRRGKPVRDLSWRRQWRDHDLPRQPAAGDLWPSELRLSARHHRRGGADDAGRRPARVRISGRRDGKPRAARLVRVEPCGICGAVHVAGKVAAAELTIWPLRHIRLR
jgi:MFS family permease